MEKHSSFPERRKYLRIKKSFIMSYYLQTEPAIRYKVTQLKNISKGGMCFITAQKYDPSAKIIVELRTPYLADTTLLYGTVLESQEKIPNIIYETRIRYDELSREANLLLGKLEELFRKGVINANE